MFSFYIFTFLIFRELNKPQSTRIKQQNVIGIRAFDSRLCIGYSTIETKEAARIGYNGFLFQHKYSGEGRGA